MKRYQVIILPSAERDIGEAYEWLAEQDTESANRWYNRLLEVILLLDTFPERCALAPESEFFNVDIREIFHGRRRHKYRILFTVSGNEVHVLHVRHGARLALGKTESSEE
ncbi:MAG TPA: type II toxin-antitoxin system RelE/ParE family toxin [Verrucomicrobiae bacterium]|nr:type II toxin-antitoxin system RelE/ParE family toxin [Verrucomicrobiae bacterium]